MNQGHSCLRFTLHQPTGDDEWLLVMQEMALVVQSQLHQVKQLAQLQTLEQVASRNANL